LLSSKRRWNEAVDAHFSRKGTNSERRPAKRAAPEIRFERKREQIQRELVCWSLISGATTGAAMTAVAMAGFGRGHFAAQNICRGHRKDHSEQKSRCDFCELQSHSVHPISKPVSHKRNRLANIRLIPAELLLIFRVECIRQ
jgi:hypothetical protein